MIRAYDKLYLEKARTNLGRMLDFAVYDLHYEIDIFFDLFVTSGVAARFESGDFTLIAGMSGVELAYRYWKNLILHITESNRITQQIAVKRTGPAGHLHIINGLPLYLSKRLFNIFQFAILLICIGLIMKWIFANL